MLIHGIIGSIARVLVMLVAAYLVYVFAMKEKGNIAKLGKALTWTLTIIAALTFLFDLSYFATHKHCPGEGRELGHPRFAIEQKDGPRGQANRTEEKTARPAAEQPAPEQNH